MPTPSILLPTNLLFTCPNSAGYDQAIEDFINDKLTYRDGMSVEDKWCLLINAFSRGLSASERATFESFKVSRQQVALGNPNVLQMANAIDYFENFYFLYRNDNPQYSLSDLEKMRLLGEVMEGMSPNLCEPGKITRFENTLQKAKKDTNWVLNELSKQRGVLIHAMADRYNVQYAVGDAYSIHTVMLMSKLGKQKGFGIELTHEINDSYLPDRQIIDITSYFDHEADQIFAQYEQDAIPNLTQHIMLEMTDWLRSNRVDLSAWEANEIGLSDEQLDAFNRFIPSLFENQTIQGLGDYNDDGDRFFLFNKTTFYRNIQQRVKDKLIEDGVFIDLAADNSDTARFATVRWPRGIESKAAIKLFEAIYPMDTHLVIDYDKVLNQHQNLLLKYPTWILARLIKNPLLWLHLPKAIRNNVEFIDKLVAELDHLLSERDPANESGLIDVLWTLTRANKAYLEKLSPGVLREKSVALKLLAKDGLLLRLMPDELRADPEVQRAAANQNLMAQMYAINHDQDPMFIFQYSDVSSQLAALDLLPDDSVPSAIGPRQPSLAHLEKMLNRLTLAKQPFISTGRLIRLGELLTPKEVHQVNQARLKHGLSSLPHCNGDLLMQFSHDVGHDNDWSNHGYLATKRQITASAQDLNPVAFLSHDYRARIAKQAILESNQWVLAFIAYQKQIPAYHVAFRSVDDLMSQLKINAKAFHVFLASIWRLLRDELQRYLLTFMLVFILPLIVGVLFVALAWLIVFVPLILLIPSSVLIAHPWPILIGVMLSILLSVALAADNSWHIFGNYTTSARYVAALSIALFYLIFPAQFIYIAVNILIFTANYLMHKLLTNILQIFPAFIEAALGSWQGFTFLSSMWAVITEWPPLFVASIVPLLTRSWATIVSQMVTPTGDEALIMNIEDNIFRLLNSDESSAVIKGELLEVLWDKVQADADPLFGYEPSFRERLDKQYTVTVSGNERQQLSFREVAATPRVDATQFIPKAADARFSFFGLRGKTTTTSQLPYAERVPQP